MKTEQLQLDTRSDLAVAISEEAARAMDNILSLIEESPFTKPPVHNRHEAYGVAAEHYSKIAGCTKIIKKDCEDLLTTLPDPSLNAIEATSAIVNSINKSAVIILYAAAEMRLTLEGLFAAENGQGIDPGDDQPTIFDFADAKPLEDTEKQEED